MSEENDIPAPRTNTELVGHAAAEKAFLSAWNSGRVPHAWLINGPRGIGKATLAFRIARFVLSEGTSGGGGGGLFGGAPDSLAMKPDHSIFRRVASGGHSDIRVLDLESEEKTSKLISADSVRTIPSFLSLTAGEGGWRVVILNSLDELNRTGANSLLKIVEEPPRNSLLLLVCHSPGRVLATIRSRCRSLTLSPLPEATIVELLARYRPGIKPEDAAALARLADGSIGAALALDAEGGLGLYRDMLDVLDRLPKLDVPELHKFAERLGRDQASFRTLGELLSRWLSRGIATVGRGRDDIEDSAGRLIGAGGLDRWLELWEKTGRSFERAEAVNLDRKQVVLNAFLSVQRLSRA